jgi:hypothetical protein
VLLLCSCLLCFNTDICLPHSGAVLQDQCKNAMELIRGALEAMVNQEDEIKIRVSVRADVEMFFHACVTTQPAMANSIK